VRKLRFAVLIALFVVAGCAAGAKDVRIADAPETTPSPASPETTSPEPTHSATPTIASTPESTHTAIPTGTFSGQVEGSPGGYASFVVYAMDGKGRVEVAHTGSWADGVYRSIAIPAGRYKVLFVNPSGGGGAGWAYRSEWYGGSTTKDGAKTIEVRGGENTTGIDAILELAPPPVNDNMANATVVRSLPFADTVDTRNATRETDEPPPHAGCDEMSKTIWYRYTPSVEGQVTVDTAHPETDFDTVIAVYTGDSKPDERVACAQLNVHFDLQKGTPTATRATFSATPGTTYWIQVGGWSKSDGGTVKVTIYTS
jgi:hypothetical protein